MSHPEDMPHRELLADQTAVLRSPLGKALHSGTLVREIPARIALFGTRRRDPDVVLPQISLR